VSSAQLIDQTGAQTIVIILLPLRLVYRIAPSTVCFIRSKDAVANKLAFIAAVIVLLTVFLAQGIAFIHANSQTFDEAVHLAAGYSYLTKHDFHLNFEHPPLIKELAALPVMLWYHLPFEPDPALWSASREFRIGKDFLYGNEIPGQDLLILGRLPNLVLGAVLIGVMAIWAYRLWGRAAALMAMTLAAFEPNLIAHSSLITLDLGAALFIFLTLYFAWEYTGSPSSWLLGAIGLTTGLALATKGSTVFLPGVVAIVMGASGLWGNSLLFFDVEKKRGGKQIVPRLVEAVLSTCLVMSLAAVVIVACYFFLNDSLRWWDGLRFQLRHQQQGHPSFFLGEYSHTGWWTYFPVAFLIKTPVGSLLLILVSLLLYRVGKPLRGRDAAFLLLAVALMFAAMTQARINIGIRYILWVYPFLYVAASRIATVRFRRSWCAPLVWSIPLALTAISSLRIGPHELGYFNELVGGPEEGYRYLHSSNLDWGQGLLELKAYMDLENVPMIYLAYHGTAVPESYGIRYQYVPGFYWWAPPQDSMPMGMYRELLAISVTNLQGVSFEDKERYHWLYRRTPLAKIGYSIHVYDLTGDANGHLELAKVYIKAQSYVLAKRELRKVLAIDPSCSEGDDLLHSMPKP
jgi:hypothetical protein